MAYREHVDVAMKGLMTSGAQDSELSFLVALGLNHEQQHQELLLTDIKHAFFSESGAISGQSFADGAALDRLIRLSI